MGAASRQADSAATVVRPDQGAWGGLAPGVGVRFLIEGEATGGAVTVVEHSFVVGAIVPPHVHTREDEISYVLAGEIGFRSNDAEVVLGAGGCIRKPRDEVHAMWNAGSSPARLVEVITPAGFEGFFHGIVEMTSSGTVDFERLAHLVDSYGRAVAEPAWLADVIARYRLTPPPQMSR